MADRKWSLVSVRQHEGAGWAYAGARGVARVALAHPLCISQCSNLPLCSLCVKLEAVGVASLQPQSFVQHTHSSVLQLYLIHLQTDRWRDRWRDRWVSRVGVEGGQVQEGGRG